MLTEDGNPLGDISANETSLAATVDCSPRKIMLLLAADEISFVTIQLVYCSPSF